MSTKSSKIIEFEVGRKNPYQLEVTRQDIVMRGLPPSMHGATFAHVTDIHAGFADLEKVYAEAVAQVNASEPDYIFFTGDYVDRRTDNPNYPIVELLQSFRARREVFGCLGNHDHKRGKVLTNKILKRAGVQVLANESVRLDSGLWIAGVDDLHEGAPDLGRTFADLPTEQTSIVLSHNPRLIEQSHGRDIVILSGHTHGGQFNLAFPPPLVICYLHLGCWQVSGWYQRGDSRLYVSRGLGVTGKPYRINCPAEIAIFRMVPHPSDNSGGSNEHAATEGATAAAGRR